ncbi:MAG: hypothetical protein ABID63_12395 [Pseudomonadota bacterium]
MLQDTGQINCFVTGTAQAPPFRRRAMKLQRHLGTWRYRPKMFNCSQDENWSQYRMYIARNPAKTAMFATIMPDLEIVMVPGFDSFMKTFPDLPTYLSTDNVNLFPHKNLAPRRCLRQGAGNSALQTRK